MGLILVSLFSAVIDESTRKDEDKFKLPRIDLNGTTVNTILSLVFGLLGGLALIFIVYGGIKMISSQGDPQGLAKARNTIIYASVGLAICILAFTIVNFVVSKLP